MRVYFDTEFEGLYRNAKLISLGLVSEDDKELYIEFNDIDVNNQSDWIKQNVLINTIYYGGKDVSIITEEENYFVGNREQICGVLRNWFKQFPEVQLVSDVCHFDMVLFIDIFRTAFDLPSNINSSCHNINQDIAKYYYITDQSAFDFNREEILEQNNIYIEGEKHNSLYDAKVIREIHKIVSR